MWVDCYPVGASDQITAMPAKKYFSRVPYVSRMQSSVFTVCMMCIL